jgi:hypothetical protein
LNGGGATTGGSVDIANGTLQTTAVNIASGTGTGTVTIGNVSNTTTINSGTINMYGNLIMGTGDNITLQPTAGIVSPTAFTQLGGTSYNQSSGLTLTLGFGIVVMSVQITRAGTYLFTCGSQTTYTSGFTYFYSNIYEKSTSMTVNTLASGGTTLNVTGNFGQELVGNVFGNNYINTNGSYIYTVPASKVNYYYAFIMYVSGGGTLGTFNSYFNITRLA